MTGRRFLTVGVGLLAGLVLGGQGVCAGGYQVAARGKLSLGHDTNALEKVREERRAADQFLRLEAGIDLQSQTAAPWQPQRMTLRWAADRYRTYREETRALLDGRVRWSWGHAGKRVGLSWRGTWKEHPDAAWRALGRQEILLDGARTLRPHLEWRWEARGFQASTAHDGPAGRTGWQIETLLGRQWGRSWKASLRVAGGGTHLDERALADPAEAGDGLLDEDHADAQMLGGVRIDRLSGPRGSLSYDVRTIDSNSFGYDQMRHEVEATLAFRLPLRSTLLVVGRWQEPVYREDGYRVYRLRDDPDDPDLGARSGVTLQLSRPLAPSLTADVRAGWQRNESRVSGRYYEKTTVTVGLRYAASAQ